jgi:hypothetical protein
MNGSESSPNHLREKAEKRARALAEALAEVEAREPDHNATKLLDRRAGRKDRLAKFKEKQKRQLRWLPLRSAIDWLKEFNERGERCAPNERLAEIRTAEIWGALTGSDILFAKYQLGNNGFAHCLIEDDANSQAVSRVSADDIAGASKDPQMISALIDVLWVPRVLLLNLFQEKKWPVAPWLNEPSPPVAEIIPSNSAAMSPENSEEEPAKSGLPGRPTSKSLYLVKLNERAETGEVADTLKAEAEFLFQWLKTTYPTHPLSGTSAIRNMIREDYNRSKKPKIESPTAN